MRVAQAIAAGAIEIPRVSEIVSNSTTGQWSFTREPFFMAERLAGAPALLIAWNDWTIPGWSSL